MLDKRATNGGARRNAGRKPKTEKYASAIEVAERRCADNLPHRLGQLEELADGKATQTKTEWAAAGTVTIGKGAYVKPAFPNLPPEQLVLVSKEEITFAPDARVNMYLADRVMGKPESADELKIAQAVEAEIDIILAKIRAALPAGTAEQVIDAISNGG